MSTPKVKIVTRKEVEITMAELTVILAEKFNLDMEEEDVNIEFMVDDDTDNDFYDEDVQGIKLVARTKNDREE